MAYKLAMLLGLTALLTVLMVDPADSACCRATKRKCSGWFWNHRCTGRCYDGTQGTPYCGYGPCNWFGCNCRGGCRHSKRDVAEEALGLLELLRGEQEDIAPEEGAMDGREFADTASEESALAGRGFGDHDTDQDMKLSKQEALGMLEALGEVDVANLPADWFESMDTNGNGFIDPEEYDEDEAKTHQ
ncbi:uncharacterized protein LOC118406825 [Branchiostoma floridae]|uniref:Uncharacterized protein LOC118406825 n=1 Tax=Branchiostoma floridae TaxID=7739 RepID=A0A9J7HPD1_BRAFL|nr:uncharacterized protein LOC118406825 [Branchiostoma floridae]